MTELPPGVTIDVYQSRIDYSEHKLEVAVANGGETYERAPTTIRPGTTTDLRLDNRLHRHRRNVSSHCDPHVVLENKRGTFFTFTVTTAQDTGRNLYRRE